MYARMAKNSDHRNMHSTTKIMCIRYTKTVSVSGGFTNFQPGPAVDPTCGV